MNSLLSGVLLLLGITALRADESKLVAAVLIAEAGGEGRRGMEAVMEVIQSRAKAHRKSPGAVVTARNQFSCLNETTVDNLVRTAKAHPRWSFALALAKRGTRTNHTGGADHYFATWCSPSWAKGKRGTVTLGRHVFLKLSSRPGKMRKET
jgi:spore germination cell wall hydrolase CwlJ-like protein